MIRRRKRRRRILAFFFSNRNLAQRIWPKCPLKTRWITTALSSSSFFCSFRRWISSFSNIAACLILYKFVRAGEIKNISIKKIKSRQKKKQQKTYYNILYMLFEQRSQPYDVFSLLSAHKLSFLPNIF